MWKILGSDYEIPWNEPSIKIIDPRIYGLEKTATSEVKNYVSGLKSKPGKTVVWLIALGAGEFFGCNRNGDYFQENVLKKYHSTFVSHGCVYKHHLNKDPAKSFGRVLESFYNDKMHRVELVCELDNDKCCSEIDKIRAGNDVAVSMACRVPYDVCSICGNRARSVAAYCDHLKNQMTEILSDGRQVYADNTEPTFFDISIVWKPADRIAYILEKVASASVVPSAVVAEEMGLQDKEYEWSKSAREKLALLKKLSEIEKEIENNLTSPGALIEEAPKALISEELDGPTLCKLKALPNDGVLKSLADSGISLTPKEFVKFILSDAPESEEIASAVHSKLPGIFGRILGGLGLPSFLENGIFEFDRPPVPQGLSKILSNLMSSRSLFHRPAAHRIVKITIIAKSPKTPELVEKSSSDRYKVSEDLARSYAMYKLAMLHSSEACKSDPSFATLSVLQNYFVCGN